MLKEFILVMVAHTLVDFTLINLHCAQILPVRVYALILAWEVVRIIVPEVVLITQTSILRIRME